MRGRPMSSSAASSSFRPFLQGTPRAKRSSASCQILSSTFCGSPGMYSATWRRRLSPARPRPPALNFSISAGSGRPSAAHAGSHRVSHRRSVSNISPSISKITPLTIGGHPFTVLFCLFKAIVPQFWRSRNTPAHGVSAFFSVGIPAFSAGVHPCRAGPARYACRPASACRPSRWPRAYNSVNVSTLPSNRLIVIGSCGRRQ